MCVCVSVHIYIYIHIDVVCVCICVSMSTFLKGPFGYSYLDMLKNSTLTLTLYADSILLLKNTGVALNLNPKALNTIGGPNVNPWLGP